MAGRKCRKKCIYPRRYVVIRRVHGRQASLRHPPPPSSPPPPLPASSGSSGESFIHSVVPLIKNRNIKVFAARRGAAKRQPHKHPFSDGLILTGKHRVIVYRRIDELFHWTSRCIIKKQIMRLYRDTIPIWSIGWIVEQKWISLDNFSINGIKFKNKIQR